MICDKCGISQELCQEKKFTRKTVLTFEAKSGLVDLAHKPVLAKNKVILCDDCTDELYKWVNF